MSDADIVTFGCRLNAYESEAIRERLKKAGIEDAIVVNTCAVTAEAVRQSHQTIRKLKREQPEKRIIVTGCAAQVIPDRYAAMEEVDLVLGNAEKMLATNYARGANTRTRVGDIMAVDKIEPHFVPGFEGRARAFLQVQNGCDHRCTFCIIPFGRGPSRSVHPDAIIREARGLVENGYNEIVLTGVDLTSFGGDLGNTPSLGQLVRHLLKELPELKRLRLSSIDSIEADTTLMEAIAEEERLMPHFHLSAQSGDDMILKRMKRRHSRTDTVRFCEGVRRLRPDALFGADIIAGFPTETDEMFENSLKLVDDAGLSLLHVFPFSPRTGTPAAKMPQLPRPLVKERARILRLKGEAALAATLERMVGSVQEILVEKEGVGRTPNYLPVMFNGTMLPGDIVQGHIVKAGNGHLHADILT